MMTMDRTTVNLSPRLLPPGLEECATLRCEGNTGLIGTPTVAVVGSRAATTYGTRIADEIAAGLADEGCTIASGGGFGIDGVAVRAAMSVPGNALIVAPCGLDNPYPVAHAELYRQVAMNDGLLVSPFDDDALPSRYRFEIQRRLLAHLADAVVVVEASKRSGAIVVAENAVSLGKPVMAVPGPVTSAMSAGCHELIRAGIPLVTSAADVLETIEKARRR